MDTKNRVLKIVLHGAQSSGKTTLTRQLAVHFKTPWVPEFSRHFLEVKGKIEAADLWPILWGGAAWQNAMLSEANHILFCDTDCFTSQVYGAFYYGRQDAEIEAFCRAHRGDFYLFCESDLPFETEEKQRDSEEIQTELRARFWAILERENLPFEVVRGSDEARLQNAIALVEKLGAR